MKNLLVQILGWKATVIQGDPSTFDRWNWLKQHLTPGALKTLEAGCGTGAFSLYAAKIGNDVLGISNQPENNNSAQIRAHILGIKNVRFVTIDLRKLGEHIHKLGNFDQIICFETIEHISDDQKVVANLSKLLRPGGKILLTVPYKEHKSLLGETVSKTEDGGHVRWGYSFEELESMFENCGVKIIRKDFISGYITQKLMNLTWALDRLHPYLSWATVLPLRLFLFLDHPLTHLIQYPYLSIAVVGVKK